MEMRDGFSKKTCLPGTSHPLVVCSVCFFVVVFLTHIKNIVVYVMISVCLIVAQTLTFSNFHKSKSFTLCLTRGSLKLHAFWTSFR